MGTPYLAEIRATSFAFAPKGWAMCNGQLLPINQNQALFSILGTQYGGDGRVNFALPDLRGRVPMHRSGTHLQGAAGGEEAHALNLSELPAHKHSFVNSEAAATSASPAGALPAAVPSGGAPVYAPAQHLVSLNPAAVGTAGGSGGFTAPHENRQPYLTVNFMIALQGIFPSRN